MQKDMHYYGTYSIARIAGFKPKEANIIAYSSQFVDDSTHINSETHDDGGMLYGIATAHHPLQVGLVHWCHEILHRKIGNVEQRRLWVPFHFYPGNQGNSFSEKLICRKNSLIVNEMFDNHIRQKNCPFILQLIGIASHVYMDTFSHYGFSGKSSRNNKVKFNSFSFDEQEKKQCLNHLKEFNKKYKREYITENWRNKSRSVSFFSSIARIKGLHWIHIILGRFAEIGSGALGHGAVATLPDQPYLKWSFSYENRDETSERNNPQTYLEGCENLYLKLKQFAQLYYSGEQLVYVDFVQVRESISQILSYNKEDEENRIAKWKEYIKNNKLFKVQEGEFLDYKQKEWKNQKLEKFHNLSTSSKAVDLPIYKFHQAADYHRHYTLKQLLPKYGIIVN